MWKHELAADNLANPVDRQVGGRLRSRRIALNMSAESFARASGTTPQRVREWEAGTSRIGAARLLELTKILDVNPAFFFANERHDGLNGKAGPREARRLDSIFRSEPSVEVFRLIRAFASIESQSSREAVIKFAESKAEKYSESSSKKEGFKGRRGVERIAVVRFESASQNSKRSQQPGK